MGGCVGGDFVLGVLTPNPYLTSTNRMLSILKRSLKFGFRQVHTITLK